MNRVFADRISSGGGGVQEVRRARNKDRFWNRLRERVDVLGGINRLAASFSKDSDPLALEGFNALAELQGSLIGVRARRALPNRGPRQLQRSSGRGSATDNAGSRRGRTHRTFESPGNGAK